MSVQLQVIKELKKERKDLKFTLGVVGGLFLGTIIFLCFQLYFLNQVKIDAELINAQQSIEILEYKKIIKNLK